MISTEEVEYCIIDVNRTVTFRLAERKNIFVSNPVSLENSLDSTKNTILRNINSRNVRQRALETSQGALENLYRGRV